MKLEEEIRQKQFRNQGQKCVINIMFTNNWLEQKFKDILAAYDITPQQFNVLRILRGQYPTFVSTSTIRDRLIDKNSDTSRIVDRLTKKEMVEKFLCKEDKRLVNIRISEKGLALLAQMDVHQNEMDNLTSALNEEELITLNELLDKIRG